MLRIVSFALACLLAAFLFAGCASNNRARLAGAPPPFLELKTAQSISTIHFPRGYYSLADEDRDGYYYRSPRKVIKHAFAGFQPYEGGIFVSKRNSHLRGYTIWAGGRVKIGNIPASAIEFRN